MKKHYHFSLFAVLISFVLLGAGCSGNYTTSMPNTTTLKAQPTSDTQPTSNIQAPTGNMAIKIENFSFQPANLTVKSGTTIIWTNNDSAPHTISADGGSFDSGTMSRGDTFTYTFTDSGTVEYFCSFHKSMRGSITVTE